MLAAESPGLAPALVLFSYPLHPPARPDQKRTAFFPDLRTPVLFVHGSRDPFGSLEELSEAIALIPARTELLAIDGAGHDLRRAPNLAAEAPERFRALVCYPGE
jgi:predicted alpha/beta-hydrolase family hydrolase